MLRADGIGYGAGRYAFAGPVLGHYRQRLQNPEERRKLLDALEEALTRAVPEVLAYQRSYRD